MPPSGTGGIWPSQMIREAIEKGWISCGERRPPALEIQPASLDLRLEGRASALRCSFLPNSSSTVEEKLAELSYETIDLREDGATLSPGRPYLVKLVESLRLPPGVRAKANPKSSTGRLDVFTRVITSKTDRFDEIPAGYQGPLYLEVVPRSFPIRVKELDCLNQLRLMTGDPRCSDTDLLTAHRAEPVLYRNGKPLEESELRLGEGLLLSAWLGTKTTEVVGYRARQNVAPIDISKIGAYAWGDYWEPIFPERGQRVVLDPRDFYLLLSDEAVCIPPQFAAEMVAHDPNAGELRTHYAGFFDPGFGYDSRGGVSGTRAALEVRARDVPFMVEHGQPICRLVFERMIEAPEVLYGHQAGSHYQGQEVMLSKHFSDQTASRGQLEIDALAYATRTG